MCFRILIQSNGCTDTKQTSTQLSSPSSYNSSGFDSPRALNDSQQTVLTEPEPDDAPLAGPLTTTDLASLSKEEVREVSSLFSISRKGMSC